MHSRRTISELTIERGIKVSKQVSPSGLKRRRNFVSLSNVLLQCDVRSTRTVEMGRNGDAIGASDRTSDRAGRDHAAVSRFNLIGQGRDARRRGRSGQMARGWQRAE